LEEAGQGCPLRIEGLHRLGLGEMVMHVEVLHGVRPSQPPRPRVMQGLAARLNLKRSQG